MAGVVVVGFISIDDPTSARICWRFVFGCTGVELSTAAVVTVALTCVNTTTRE